MLGCRMPFRFLRCYAGRAIMSAKGKCCTVANELLAWRGNLNLPALDSAGSRPRQKVRRNHAEVAGGTDLTELSEPS